jgi:membrane-bound lytic murein transglycosylase C
MRKQAPHLWVEYSADTQSVAAVDFREGEVAVSVLLDANATEQTVRERMTSEVTRILVSKGGGALAPIARPEAETGFDRPLLRELVRTRHGLYRDSMDAPVVARDILDSADIRIGAVAEQDQSPRAATVRFRLAPDYIRRLMSPYVSLVRKYSARFDVDPALVLAMIHTESHFNPVARSSANALGLMQLVPDGGGRDAYAYVTGEDRIPLDDYFLDPENNIRLGCAYVYLLKTRHFGEVLDPNSNRYCTIAGYNTGPGNVAYAFTGKRSLQPAVAVINRMSDHQEVYAFMIRNLPYSQTRHYLRKVVSRMATYAEANL